jgi:hypothetical protein
MSLRIINFIKNIKIVSHTNTTNYGRWNTKDNSAIKEVLANMDCCGGQLCGEPINYSKNIKKILKK